MKLLWLLPSLSLLALTAVRASPLTSASSQAFNPSSTVAGAWTISAAPSLNWTANTSAVSTSQRSLVNNSSTKATNDTGPVTVLKTIELIPQPVPSNSTVGASRFLEHAKNQKSNVRPSAIDAQQPTSPTLPLPAKPISSSEPRNTSNSQVPVPQPIDESVKRPKLQPIIVGGITYAPVHAHHTHGGAVPWRESLRASQTWEQNGLDHGNLKPWQGQVDLPPVIVGGLTYTPKGKEFHVAWQTPAPVSIAASISETPSANLTVENPTSILTTSGASTTQGMSNPPTVNETLVPFDSTTTSVDGTISGQAVVPASPSTFIIAGETFTAYPSGLAIDGTEVFQGSTAITLSGTAISLGSSDLVIGTNTIPFASVTGLEAALSSGLTAVVSASGDGSGPTATSTSAKNTHQSAAGRSTAEITGSPAMVWLTIIVLTMGVM